MFNNGTKLVSPKSVFKRAICIPRRRKRTISKSAGKQYLHSTFSAQNTPLDNDRYPDIQWTSAIDVISKV
jgi:hypothetical protein